MRRPYELRGLKYYEILIASRTKGLYRKMTSCNSLSWEELKTAIHEAFSTDCVDVDYVKGLMSAYRSNKEDWSKFALFDPYRYTRNLVDEGNGRYNLIVLCWGEGLGSCIHDHADSHCFMKILSGMLKETQFAWPASSSEELRPMAQTGSHLYNTDEVTYINDSIGLHRVENPSHTDTAVSLHLYSPPITICNSFEERTGRPHCCKVTFYSKQGARTSHQN